MNTLLHDKAPYPSRLAPLLVGVAVAIALAACGKGAAKDDHGAEGGKHAEHAGEPGGEHAEGEPELTLTSAEAERAGVRVEEVKPQPLGETVVVTATIQPDQDRLARVAPRIDGRVASAPVKLGDRVRARQVLATLDSVEVGEAHAAWAQRLRVFRACPSSASEDVRFRRQAQP